MKTTTVLLLAAGVLMLMVGTVAVFSEQGGVADDGRKVLLKDDGTWVYVVEEATPAEDQRDFRGASWGMSKPQVMASEGDSPVQESDDKLLYERSIGAMGCVVLYTFTAGRLSSGSYIFTVSHSNSNDYIDDYASIEALLTEKYGVQEVADIQSWKNDLFKSRPQSWGTAVAAGHLDYISRRTTPRTDIGHMLHGDNYEITHGILYMSRELSGEARAADEKKRLDDL